MAKVDASAGVGGLPRHWTTRLPVSMSQIAQVMSPELVIIWRSSMNLQQDRYPVCASSIAPGPSVPSTRAVVPGAVSWTGSRRRRARERDNTVSVPAAVGVFERKEGCICG